MAGPKTSEELTALVQRTADLEMEEANSRQLRAALRTTEKTRPNNIVARVGTAVAAASITTYADTQIGDGKGDGVKIGTAIASAGFAAVAWKMGKPTVSHVFQDVVLGIAVAEATIISRDAGLDMGTEKAKKQAQERAKAAKGEQPAAKPQS